MVRGRVRAAGGERRRAGSGHGLLAAWLAMAGCFTDDGPPQDGAAGTTSTSGPVTSGESSTSGGEASTSGAVDATGESSGGPEVTTSGPTDATTTGAGTTSGPVVPPCPSDEDLRACFRFEDALEPGLDESVYANDAAVSGADLVPGMVGMALNLPAKSVVQANYAAHLTPGQTVTTSLWFFARTLPVMDGYRMVLLDKDANYGIIIRPTGLGCTFHGVPQNMVPVTPNRWTHVTCTHDADGFATMYLDGEQVGAAELVGLIDEPPPAPLSLGNDSPAAKETDAFDGVIDEVRVWSRVLSADEIKVQAGI